MTFCYYEPPVQPLPIQHRCIMSTPLGVAQSHWAVRMLVCSTGYLLTRASFMHHDDQGKDALMHYAALNAD